MPTVTQEEFIRTNNVMGYNDPFGSVATILPDKCLLTQNVANTAKPLKQYQNILTNGTLFIGGINVIENNDFLELYNITAIVSVCTVDEMNSFNLNKKIKHCVLNIEDISRPEIFINGELYCKNECDFIHQEIQNNGRVLVHCVAGMSRSALVVAIYLMLYHKFDFDDETVNSVIKYLKSRRGCINIYPHAIYQLQKYDKLKPYINT